MTGQGQGGQVVALVPEEETLEALGLRIDGAMEAFRKHYKADNADQKLRFLVRDMIHPLLELMRKEYIGGLSYLEDELQAGASEEFTDQTRRTIAAMGQVLDATWVTVGWMDQKGYTDKAPEDLKKLMEAASALVRELLERADAEDEGDDDDDDGDDDPDGGEDAAGEDDVDEEGAA